MKTVLYVGLALLALGLIFQTWQNRNLDQEVRALQDEAARLVELADERRDSLTAMRERTGQLLRRQRQEIMDSIARIPAAASRLEFTEFVDTIEVTADIRARIRAATLPIIEERDQLRAVVEGIPQLLAQRDSIWLLRVKETEAVASLETQARERLERALELEQQKRRPGVLSTMLCAGGGGAIASLVSPDIATIGIGALAGVGGCSLLRR